MIKTKNTTKSDENLLNLILGSIFLDNDLKAQYKEMLLQGMFTEEQKQKLSEILAKESQSLTKLLTDNQYEKTRKKIYPITKELVWDKAKKILIEKARRGQLEEKECKEVISSLREVLQESQEHSSAATIEHITEKFKVLRELKSQISLEERERMEKFAQHLLELIISRHGIEKFKSISIEIQKGDLKDAITKLPPKYADLIDEACEQFLSIDND